MHGDAGATVQAVTAAESTAAEQRAIAAGIPSRTLMQRAGAAAAKSISGRYAGRLRNGVVIFAGSGNNGGDGWTVAGALAATGARVEVRQFGDLSTAEARGERDAHVHLVAHHGALPGPGVVVDALLGTGSRGAPRGAVAGAIVAIAELRVRGARVVALDVPSGLDATSGERTGCVVADLTLCFGTLKRGCLISRDACGTIEVLDIGLGAHAIGSGLALVDGALVNSLVRPIAADAHKGTRGRVAIVGGAYGMAGAVMLAAEGAWRAGAGLVRLVVEEESVRAVQVGAPQCTAAAWPARRSALDDDETVRALGGADALVVGPGLGSAQRAAVERVLAASGAPCVLDADALNAYAGAPEAMRSALGGRPALITPHPGECARLLGIGIDDVLAGRFDIGRELARRCGATVLLKGTPTVITAEDGAVRVLSLIHI